MRHKLRVFSLVLIVVFIFIFTACTTSKTASETTTVETTITETAVSETTAAAAAVSETTAEAAIEKGEYSVGDTGPAGGLIFYVNPNYETDGWRYMEAAPATTEWTDIPWSNITSAVSGASGTAIGTGQANTATIIGQSGHTASAAQLCNDLASGGYDDWFLPSKDELGLIYKNLAKAGLGGFATGNYWSSSETSARYSGYQYFSLGSQSNDYKYQGLRVRAIRAF